MKDVGLDGRCCDPVGNVFVRNPPHRDDSIIDTEVGSDVQEFAVEHLSNHDNSRVGNMFENPGQRANERHTIP